MAHKVHGKDLNAENCPSTIFTRLLAVTYLMLQMEIDGKFLTLSTVILKWPA